MNDDDIDIPPINPPTPVDDPNASTPNGDPPATPPSTQTETTPPPTPEFNLDEYVAGVKVDEGKDYTFDQDLLKAVAPVANELGIKPEALGKLANLLATKQGEDMAKHAKAQADFNARREAYVKQLDEATAQLRKDNPRFDANVNAAMELDFVKGSEFAKIFSQSELSHDPVVLQLLERAGRTVAREEGVGVNSPPNNGGENLSFAEIMSGGLFK